jgi:ribosomal-protein-alanine N-acetyltransferase
MDRVLEIDKGMQAESWSASHFLQELPEKWHISRAAIQSGELIGFMIASSKRGSLHVHRISVAPEYRGNGIGSALIHRLAEDAEVLGVRSITLKVSRVNTQAIRFYMRLGFRTTGGDQQNSAMEADLKALSGITC